MARLSMIAQLRAILIAGLLALALPALAKDEKGMAEAEKAMAGEKLDINTASKKELIALPGIGEVRAEAIIKGRPYRGKNELAEKNIIPQEVYDKVKDMIIAKQKM
jgi:competence protein ComEA